ncbi:MAG: mercuric transporter MerT family protein [Methylohalobius sp.]|nr:mercuric transporter MerT family protein [Methylohalobius sp.]
MHRPGNGSLIASVVAAIGASTCCVLPFVLMILGIGGSWLSALTAMAPYRPFFIGFAFLFLALACYRLYFKPRACAPGVPCADTSALARQRRIFWIVAGFVLILLAAPRLILLLY